MNVSGHISDVDYVAKIRSELSIILLEKNQEYLNRLKRPRGPSICVAKTRPKIWPPFLLLSLKVNTDSLLSVFLIFSLINFSFFFLLALFTTIYSVYLHLEKLLGQGQVFIGFKFFYIFTIFCQRWFILLLEDNCDFYLENG